MKTKIIRIGNSRGLRLPKKLIDLYGLQEGSDIEIEENRSGILLRPMKQEYTLQWEEAYRQMAAEREENLEWEEWESTHEDGLDD
ncbi:MAG: AbrB/MazE/SpoVT family DNA-binding domain-containing protein [Spirochaetia bacterium]